MNEKLSLQDLAKILSKQTDVSIDDAELFLKELFDLILERIYENDLVKVKDFGTFKLVPISSRQSVDVNTGEKIEIPAHNRFTFVADRALKDIVNVPYSKLETVLLEDGVDPSDIVFEVLDEDDEPEIDDSVTSIENNEVSKVIQEQARIINEIKGAIASTDLSESKEESIKPKAVIVEAISDSFVPQAKKEDDLLPPPPLPRIGEQVRLPKASERLDPEKKLRDLNLPREKRLIELRDPIIRGGLTGLPKVENRFNQIEISTFGPSASGSVVEDEPVLEPVNDVLDRPLIPIEETEETEDTYGAVDLTSEASASSAAVDSDSLFTDVNSELSQEKPNFWDGEAIPEMLDPLELRRNLPFYQRVSTKIFIWITVILTVLVAGYLLFNLFRVEYDYEKYMDNNSNISLSITDTLPDLYTDNLSEDVLLDTNVVVADSSIDDTVQYVRIFSQNLTNFEVSKNLVIAKVNKVAAFHNKQALKKSSKTSVSKDYKVQDKVVIEAGMSLQSLAKKYYGNSMYWIYIYLVNKDSGVNPDKIEIGKELLIPSLSQFDIDDPLDAKNIEKALVLEKQLLKK